MTLSNTTQLTENQENKAYKTVSEMFEAKFTADYWHFSFEGTRLNLTSFNAECVYEVHSAKGSFIISIELSKKLEAIKSSFKSKKI